MTALERLKSSALAGPLLIVAVGAAAFASSATAGFLQWDDPYYVLTSRSAHAPGLAGFLAIFDFEQALPYHLVEFFPVRDAVYWLLWQAFGAAPAAYHLTNIAVHLVASVLVWRLALKLGFSRWVALAAGLLFTTHPVHVESVTWVSGLKDPLATSLVVGSVLAYLSYRERLRPADYALSLLLLAGALASKVLALPTVLLLLAAERMVGTPTRWPLIAARLAGPLVLTLGSLVHIVTIGRVNGVMREPHGGDWPNHVFLMGWAQVRYLQQAFVPATFRLNYCFPHVAGAADPRLWAIAVVFGLTVWLCVRAWRVDRRLAYLAFWFFACLGPYMNFIPFPSVVADRFLYSPTVATAIATALLLEKVRLKNALLATVVGVTGVITFGRGWVWHDERAIWDEVAQDDACWRDTSPLAANAVLQWAMLQKDPTEAVKEFSRVAEHPGLRGIQQVRVCERFRISALGPRQQTPALEAGAAGLESRLCFSAPASWERLAHSQLRSDPAAAARAAAQLYALDKKPLRLWQLGVSRLTAHDSGGAADVAAAAERAPTLVCPAFLQWRLRATPEQQALTAATFARCDPR